MASFDLLKAKKSKVEGPSVYSLMGVDSNGLSALRASAIDSLCPEKRLMLAVLEGALAEYQRCFGAADLMAQLKHADSRNWIFSIEQEWPFSFENICHSLSMDPDYIRQGLERWSQRPVEERTLAKGRSYVRGVRTQIMGKRKRTRRRRDKKIEIVEMADEGDKS